MDRGQRGLTWGSVGKICTGLLLETLNDGKDSPRKLLCQPGGIGFNLTIPGT